jgi:hypothetical protein
MKSFSAFVAALILLSAPAGIAQAKDAPPPSPPPYSAVGLEKYAQPGTCQLVGQARIDTKTFGPLAYAGQKVHLLPLTDYALWFVKRLADFSDMTHHSFPSELAQFNHDATTDANGNFTFNNIFCGSYLVEMFTDYQTDSHSIENRTIYSTNDDEYPSSMTTQRIRTKIFRELDVAVAASFFTREDERMTLPTLGILGFYKCCGGEI